jgi:hypothetical protein
MVFSDQLWQWHTSAEAFHGGRLIFSPQQRIHNAPKDDKHAQEDCSGIPSFD